MAVNIRTSRRLLVVIAGAVIAAAMVAPSPATALSCAHHPDATPRAIMQGTEELALGGAFDDHYTGAVFGTVLEVMTQTDEHASNEALGHANDDPSGVDGWTEVTVAVTGVLGPAVDSPAVVVQRDPGWLNGYAFEVGTHYFIPYIEQETGRYSHLCDPITEVDAADVPDLLSLAGSSAIGSGPGQDAPSQEQAASAVDNPGAGPASGPGPGSGPGPEDRATTGSGLLWAAMMIALCGLVLSLVVWVRQTGSATNEPESPMRGTSTTADSPTK